VISEVEPNDPAPYQAIGSQSGPFCIEGSAICGNADAYVDTDTFTATLPAGTWSFSLQWSGAADYDSYLWDEDPAGKPKAAVFGFTESLSSPENDSVEISAGEYWIQVGCWDGTSTGYVLTADPS
jgi:hypothetical protein